MVMVLAAIGPTEIFISALCPQDKHVQAFRWYWYSRGIDIRRNGQVFNARGEPQYGKTYEEAAREYGR